MDTWRDCQTEITPSIPKKISTHSKITAAVHLTAHCTTTNKTPRQHKPEPHASDTTRAKTRWVVQLLQQFVGGPCDSSCGAGSWRWLALRRLSLCVVGVVTQLTARRVFSIIKVTDLLPTLITAYNNIYFCIDRHGRSLRRCSGDQSKASFSQGYQCAASNALCLFTSANHHHPAYLCVSLSLCLSRLCRLCSLGRCLMSYSSPARPLSICWWWCGGWCGLVTPFFPLLFSPSIFALGRTWSPTPTQTHFHPPHQQRTTPRASSAQPTSLHRAESTITTTTTTTRTSWSTHKPSQTMTQTGNASKTVLVAGGAGCEFLLKKLCCYPQPIMSATN